MLRRAFISSTLAASLLAATTAQAATPARTGSPVDESEMATDSTVWIIGGVLVAVLLLILLLDDDDDEDLPSSP